VTRSQISMARTEEAKSIWRETQEAWISKYEKKALELLGLGDLDSAKTTYGDDLWGDAEGRAVDGLSAAYLLARKNHQTHTADTLLGMIQEQRTAASVSALPDSDRLVLIVLTLRQKLS